jgi:hypothetical protein
MGPALSVPSPPAFRPAFQPSPEASSPDPVLGPRDYPTGDDGSGGAGATPAPGPQPAAVEPHPGLEDAAADIPLNAPSPAGATEVGASSAAAEAVTDRGRREDYAGGRSAVVGDGPVGSLPPAASCS